MATAEPDSPERDRQVVRWYRLELGAVAVLAAAGLLTGFDRATQLVVKEAAEGGLSFVAGATLAGAKLVDVLAIGVTWLVVVGVRRGLRRWVGRRWIESWLPVVLAVGIGGLFFDWVSLKLVSGGWISRQSWSWMVRWGIVAGGAGLTGAVVWMVGREAFLTAGGRWRDLITAAFVLASATCLAASGSMFYGAYPSFHVGLNLLAALFALLGGARLAVSVCRRIPPGSVRAVTIAGVGLVAILLGLWLSIDRSTRSELIAKSSGSRDMTREFAPEGGRRSHVVTALSGTALDVGEHNASREPTRGLITAPERANVVLIVVDALRADTLSPVRGAGQPHAGVDDTPFIDRWLEGAYRFTHAYSQSTLTQRSMPALFRSFQSHERFRGRGNPLPRAMKWLGRTPFASVNRYFTKPIAKKYPSLLAGFERAAIYNLNTTDDHVPMTLGLVDELGKRRFFAWIHFYCMHEPGYGEGGAFAKNDGTRVEKYRRALRWLDVQLKSLVKGFARRRLLDKTVFVLASDHGENLGSNRINSHGPTAFEESSRVPLAFFVPGAPGGVVADQVVGNIDIAPTIYELIGEPADPSHRGRSLVPLMAGEQAGPEPAYFVRSGFSDVAAIVRGRDKLIHDYEGDATYRYDLEADPHENTNLFEPAGEIDRRLLVDLLRHTPGRFAEDLRDGKTVEFLEDVLVGGKDRMDERLHLALALAVHEPSGRGADAVEELFDRTESDEIRLGIARRMMDSDRARWTAKLVAWFEGVLDTPRERVIVSRLAENGQPKFAPLLVARRIRDLVTAGRRDDWQPWLRLVSSWGELKGGRFAPVAIGLIEEVTSRSGRRRRIDPLVDPLVLRQVLAVVSSLELEEGPRYRKRLASLVKIFLRHPDPRVQAAACHALGNVEHRSSAKDLRAVLMEKRRPLFVRQSALLALGRVGGKRAVPTILREGKYPWMTYDALRALGNVGAVKAAPFIRKVAETHEDLLIRRAAKKALKSIEAKAGTMKVEGQRGPPRRRKSP